MPQPKGAKRKFHKYKLLLDENLPPRQIFRQLNSRYSLKHIVHDCNMEAALDPAVYNFAAKENRLIITFNDKDFKDLASKSMSSGIIGVSNNLSYEQIDKRITSLLNKSKPSKLFGKFTYISSETIT